MSNIKEERRMSNIKKEKKENYETKLKKFDTEIREYVKSNTKYELVEKSFIDYWTETDKNNKMRFESEKFFDYGKRLGTFLTNHNKYNNFKQGKKKVSGFTEREEQAMQNFIEGK